MNTTASLRFFFAGILAAISSIAIAQSSANFKSPAFAVNAGVGDMGSGSFSVRAAVGQPFGATALSSANFVVTTGLLAIPVTTGTTANLPVFNTGVAADRTLLPGGSVDPHYTLIASAEPSLPGPNAIVTSQIAEGFWLAQGPNSKWIAPSADQSYPGANPCNAAGTYTYRTLVDLTGFDPATAVIQGKWAVDNQGTAIRLNGVNIVGVSQPGYGVFYTFTVDSGFLAGVNTLDFVTSDGGCPNGLRVELSGTATITASGPTIPDAPTNLVGVAGNAQATISFTAPLNDGGSAITSYVASCGGPPITATGSTSPITVTGLTNGVTYGCSVRAVNAIGQSAASAGVTVTPVAAAPTATYAPAGGLNFGSVPVGSTSAGQAVIFTNTSAITLTMNGITFSGGGAGFNVLGSSQCLSQSTLAAGASCTFDITATPGTPGALSDTVRVVTTPANVATPASVALQVTGSAAAGPYAYITNSGSNNVSVIDTATNTVSATVAVGTSPFAVAINASGTLAFVANFSDNTVSAIDAGNSVAAPIAVGTHPQGVALNPAGTRAYVANVGSNTTVSVIDTATRSVVATVLVGLEPLGVAAHPDGTRVYVANRQGNSVSVIDTATNTVVATVPVGVNPYGIAVNATRAYVANRFVNNVSVIDTATNTVTATVIVGTNPQGVGVNPAGTRIYVANNTSNNVSVINTAINTVVATVAVGTNPIGVSVNPAGTRVYVANNGSNNVSVIDTATNTVISTVAVGTAPAAFGAFIGTLSAPAAPVFSPSATTLTFATQAVATTSAAQTLTITNTGTANLTLAASTITGPFAISADSCVTVVPAATCAIAVTFAPVAAGAATGTLTIATNAAGSPHSIALLGTGIAAAGPGTFAYITNQNSNNVSVIDISSDTVVATIPLGGSQPYGVAVNPAGTRAYFTNQLSNNVKVIDTASNTVVATIPVGTYPNGVAVSPDGTRVYVANSSNSVSVINTATNTVIATVTAGTTPDGIAVDPAGTRVYVSNNNSNNVTVIDTTSNTVLATIPVGFGPIGVAINPAGTRVYVANSVGGISVINTATNTVVASISTGGSPESIAVSGDGTRVYIVNASGTNGRVDVIDAATNTLLNSITVGRLPVGIAINPAGTRAYVANRSDNNVSVIDIASNTVLYTVPVGSQPNAFGLFIGTPPAVTALPALTSVVSRKAHGSAGTFELLLDRTQQVGGNVTVEPRIMGAGHQVVFKFDGAITNAGTLLVVDSNSAVINTASAIYSGNEVIVTLTGSLFARRVAISLTGVNGSVNASIALGFLLGDVNNSRRVNAQDTSGIKARSGQLTNAGNFLYDITASGSITAVDVVVSKVLSGSALP